MLPSREQSSGMSGLRPFTPFGVLKSDLESGRSFRFGCAAAQRPTCDIQFILHVPESCRSFGTVPTF